MQSPLRLVLLSSSLLTACGADNDIEPELRRFEGIYEVKLHAQNEQACSPQGAVAIDDTEKFVVARVQQVFGTPFLQIASCESVAKCRELAANLDRDVFVSYDFGFTLTVPSGETDLLSTGAMSGFNDNGVCRGGEVYETTLISTGDSRPAAFRIEKAITIADDYTAERGDRCDTSSAQEAAEGNACSKMETLSAILVEPL